VTSALMIALQIMLTTGTVYAQSSQPPQSGHFCKTTVNLTSAELEKRIAHREPLRVFNFADMHISPAAKVLLKVSISSLRAVECVSLIQGHPLLAAGAIDSVRQWQFVPMARKGKFIKYGGIVVLKGTEFSG
jgi:hypothetical protein